jgi:hypothetical protein
MAEVLLFFIVLVLIVFIFYNIVFKSTFGETPNTEPASPVISDSNITIPGTLWTSPSLSGAPVGPAGPAGPASTGPVWSSTPGLVNVKKIVNLKDGTFAAIFKDNSVGVSNGILPLRFSEAPPIRAIDLITTTRGIAAISPEGEISLSMSLKNQNWEKCKNTPRMKQFYQTPNNQSIMVGENGLLYSSVNYVALANGGKVYSNTSLNGAWNLGSGDGIGGITQLNDGSIAGIKDGFIYTKNELSTSSEWTKAEPPPEMTQLIKLQNGTFMCIANDRKTYTSENPYSGWKEGYVYNALEIGQLNDGTLFTIAGPGILMTKKDRWISRLTPAKMIRLLPLKDGTFICICIVEGGDTVTYNSTDLDGPWVLGNAKNIKKIGQLIDNSLFCIGLDGFLYTNTNNTSNWKQKITIASIISLSGGSQTRIVDFKQLSDGSFILSYSNGETNISNIGHRLDSNDVLPTQKCSGKSILYFGQLDANTIFGISDGNLWTHPIGTIRNISIEWSGAPVATDVTQVSQLKDNRFIIISKGALHVSSNLGGPWILQPNSSGKTQIIELNSGGFAALANGGYLYLSSSLAGPWALQPNSGGMTQLIDRRPGNVVNNMFFAVANGGLLYSSYSLRGPWSIATETGRLSKMYVLQNGGQAAIKTDGTLIYRDRIGARWVRQENSDGMTEFLELRDALVPGYVQVPGTVDVEEFFIFRHSGFMDDIWKNDIDSYYILDKDGNLYRSASSNLLTPKWEDEPVISDIKKIYKLKEGTKYAFIKTIDSGLYTMDGLNLRVSEANNVFAKLVGKTLGSVGSFIEFNTFFGVICETEEPIVLGEIEDPLEILTDENGDPVLVNGQQITRIEASDMFSRVYPEVSKNAKDIIDNPNAKHIKALEKGAGAFVLQTIGEKLGNGYLTEHIPRSQQLATWLTGRKYKVENPLAPDYVKPPVKFPRPKAPPVSIGTRAANLATRAINAAKTPVASMASVASKAAKIPVKLAPVSINSVAKLGKSVACKMLLDELFNSVPGSEKIFDEIFPAPLGPFLKQAPYLLIQAIFILVQPLTWPVALPPFLAEVGVEIAIQQIMEHSGKIAKAFEDFGNGVAMAYTVLWNQASYTFTKAWDDTSRDLTTAAFAVDRAFNHDVKNFFEKDVARVASAFGQGIIDTANIAGQGIAQGADAYVNTVANLFGGLKTFTVAPEDDPVLIALKSRGLIPAQAPPPPTSEVARQVAAAITNASKTAQCTIM